MTRYAANQHTANLRPFAAIKSISSVVGRGIRFYKLVGRPQALTIETMMAYPGIQKTAPVSDITESGKVEQIRVRSAS